MSRGYWTYCLTLFLLSGSLWQGETFCFERTNVSQVVCSVCVRAESELDGSFPQCSISVVDVVHGAEFSPKLSA